MNRVTKQQRRCWVFIGAGLILARVLLAGENPAMAGTQVSQWRAEHRTIYLDPGSPWQNGFGGLLKNPWKWRAICSIAAHDRITGKMAGGSLCGRLLARLDSEGPYSSAG